MNHWYVLHTKPHKERFVASQLRAAELDVYLPLVRVNPSNPRAARVRPFFPGYTFINVDLDEVGLSAIQWVPGVRRLVHIGGAPAVVPNDVVEGIRTQLREIRAAGGLKFHDLNPGDHVRIVGGPFEGYEAIFDARRPGSERVRVLLEMLEQRAGRAPGRTVRVELGAGDIVRVRQRNRRGRRRRAD